MSLEELLYSIGEKTERFFVLLRCFLKELMVPTQKDKPPNFTILKRIIRRDLTIHELLSLRLQLVFLVYLLVSLLIVMFSRSLLYLFGIFILELEYVRLVVNWYRDFFVDVKPYRFFYYGVSFISFVAFEGYIFIQREFNEISYGMVYLLMILGVVLLFRWYFKQRFGRDYTYGIVEEVKNDLVRVFV
ncbi:MAG: DUF2101 domain-containing protein, partial [Crenarchaeota archaeon]|nr:DUF2101 domain-containing protein [Thermoproteota archaeon]